MQNFVFHNPTKIIFGHDTIGQIGQEVAASGCRRVLLVYGSGSIKENGVYDTVTASLASSGITTREHPGVRSNPVLSHVRAGIALARKEQVDAVVAVGGGSVLDSAKAICAGALVEHDVWQFFKGKKPIRRALPLFTVLTLAASGSEMNGGMVVTNEETRQKFGTANALLHPRVSILDPTATYSVPADYTAYGAVDAIVHILEFYCTTAATEPTAIQDRISEGLIGSIIAACDRVLADLQDYQGRADLMWGATLALNGLTAAGRGPVGLPMHMIEHSLSALYDVPHGAGLAVVAPAWMAHRAERDPGRIAQLGRRLFGSSAPDEHQAAMEAIGRLKSWFAASGCPVTLGELGIPETEIPGIAANALALARLWRLREYDEAEITAILQRCR